MHDKILVGIDEAGRGPWAGPIVAAAVALDPASKFAGLTDSKLITAKQRADLSVLIKQGAISIGIGWVDSKFIDEFGLTKATSKAMQTAVDQLTHKFNEAVIDGNIQYLPEGKYRCEIKADQKYPAVSAASIIAKVARDNYMRAMAMKYPEYGFDKHFGYGTKKHAEALASHGVCAIHRLSYKPVQAIYVNQTGKTS